jgi:hypothetical protein
MISGIYKTPATDFQKTMIFKYSVFITTSKNGKIIYTIF